MASQYDLGTIFRENGPAYLRHFTPSNTQLKVMNAVSRCRTAAMGNHAVKCNQCGHIEVMHNSCRNRHCPQCQGLDSIAWVEKIRHDLLPVGYFHVVFTIPGLLNPLALVNRQVVYDLLFRTSASTLKQLAADRKHLGIETGILAVLHTWGQNLMDHPHIHMLVPAGGLDTVTGRWKHSSRKFYLPVKALSAVFRGKFLGGLKELYNSGALKFTGRIGKLQFKKNFKDLLDQLYDTNWVVYTKKALRSGAQVMRYLGRYTHRIAISNQRIMAYDGTRVTFSWKDYHDHNRKKQMTLDVQEFMRRFLLHVLPHHYHKIRYYGLFSVRNRHLRLNAVRVKLGLKPNLKPYIKLNTRELLLKLTGRDILLCPCCRQASMMPCAAGTLLCSTG